MGGGTWGVGSNIPGWETPSLLLTEMVSPLLQPAAQEGNSRELSDRRSTAWFPPSPVISRSVRRKSPIANVSFWAQMLTVQHFTGSWTRVKGTDAVRRGWKIDLFPARFRGQLDKKLLQLGTRSPSLSSSCSLEIHSIIAFLVHILSSADRIPLGWYKLCDKGMFVSHMGCKSFLSKQANRHRNGQRGHWARESLGVLWPAEPQPTERSKHPPGCHSSLSALQRRHLQNEQFYCTISGHTALPSPKIGTPHKQEPQCCDTGVGDTPDQGASALHTGNRRNETNPATRLSTWRLEQVGHTSKAKNSDSE